MAMFINIEIKTFGWHIQVFFWNLFVVCMDSSVGRVAASINSNLFPFAQGSNPTNASISFSSFFCIFSYVSLNHVWAAILTFIQMVEPKPGKKSLNLRRNPSPSVKWKTIA